MACYREDVIACKIDARGSVDISSTPVVDKKKKETLENKCQEVFPSLLAPLPVPAVRADNPNYEINRQFL
jgi:hypothetical protein